jgi:hypothetical protein
MKIKTKKVQVVKALDCMERNIYCPYTIEWIIDTIDWLYKWRYITENECEMLCNRVIKVISYN